MTDIPSVVRVGPMPYQVLTDTAAIKAASDRAEIAEDSHWSAYSDHEKLVIAINPNNPTAVQRQDLLHEVLHCCLRVAGVEPNAYAQVVAKAKQRHGGYTVEEFSVAATATLLVGVLRDNPPLVVWLLGGDT